MTLQTVILICAHQYLLGHLNYLELRSQGHTCNPKPSIDLIYKTYRQSVPQIWLTYSKTCLKRPLKKKTNIGFQDRLSLNAGQKYCRMLQKSMLEYFRSIFIKLPFVIKMLVLSIFEWSLNTGITVNLKMMASHAK